MLEKKNQYQQEYIQKLEQSVRASEAREAEFGQVKASLSEANDRLESAKNSFARETKKLNDLIAAKDASIKEKRA